MYERKVPPRMHANSDAARHGAVPAPRVWFVQLGDEMPARDSFSNCRWCRRSGCRHHCHGMGLSLP